MQIIKAEDARPGRPNEYLAQSHTLTLYFDLCGLQIQWKKQKEVEYNERINSLCVIWNAYIYISFCNILKGANKIYKLYRTDADESNGLKI